MRPFDQAGFVFRVDELDSSQRNHVPGLQFSLINSFSIDVCPSGGTNIKDDISFRNETNLGMSARNAQVIDYQMVIALPTNVDDWVFEGKKALIFQDQ